MKPIAILARRGFFSALIIACAGLYSAAQSPVDTVEKALAYLQQLDPEKIPTAQHENAARQINAAWETIQKAGAPGRAQLKQAVTRPGQSDYFRLNGAALLWTIGGLDEAETIASLWRSTRLEVHSNYVFYPAFAAALKQDAKALPMLLAVLGNKQFQIYVSLHALEVKWPLTIQFIWGGYGPKGFPALLNVLKNSQQLVELQSAIFLFGYAQYLEALPRIRELARAGDDETRRIAIFALGFFGHPQDYDFLVAGLGSRDPEDVFFHAMALYEYEDLRAVPQLIPLLSATEVKVRREVFACLTHLLTSQSMDALVNYAQRAQGEEKAEVNEYLNSELKEYGLTLAAYSKKSPAQKAQVIDSVRQQREAKRFLLRRGEKGLTPPELLQAAEVWKKSHHMRMATGGLPVEARQLLTAATANDIDLLLEVKAAVLARLSDECLYEVERIDSVVRRVGRSRYRKDVGITAKVEAP